jgi:prepilin-type N-terminal cleavage/methylation domain-containing protein
MSHRQPSGAATGRRGFTLIELLIVVAIIAILAAIAVPNFLEAQIRSKVSRVKADLRTLATGIEAYAVDETGKYPDTQVPSPAVPMRFALEYSLVCLPKLSTPVGYLSQSLLDDLFAVGRMESPYWFYGYMNMRAAADSGELDLATGGMLTPQQRGILRDHGWLVQSVGPDRQRYADSPARFILGTLALTSRSNLDYFYDPTNGTISGGDIVRTAKGEQK